MNRCPITYQECKKKYSKAGLAKLSEQLLDLKDLPFTAQEQRQNALLKTGKMSIQGVQPKLSAKLSIRNQSLEIVEKNGNFILKPQSDIFIQVPENESLSMKMAAIFGIEVPLSGMIYSKDGSLTYFIKRFDRHGKNKKYALEDFAQLTQNTRETKYNWSMEKLIPVIENYCTFPQIEKRKLYRRTLFSFIIGNEDMHLKNFSLLTKNQQTSLSPAYDLLNSSIAMDGAIEEMALPLAGKKRKLKKEHLIDYFGKEKLKLNPETLNLELQNLKNKKADLEKMISISFLNQEMKDKYLNLLQERYQRFGI